MATQTDIETAAVAEATRLCDSAIAALARLQEQPFASPSLCARAKRYQIDEFSRTSRKTERVVFEIRRDKWASRDELLAAIDLYCAAGVAEVERRFRAIAAEKG